MKSKIYLCSFANQRYQKALHRLVFEAEQLGLFDGVFTYGEDDLQGDYWVKYGDFIKNNPRGFGYWIWKSHIVNIVLNDLNYNDILVYLDAGCGINHIYGRKTFIKYVDMLRQSSSGVLCFENGYTEAHWVKGDVLDYFNVRGREDILGSEQIMGGIWMIEKRPTTIELCKTWEDIIHNHLNLIDDSPSVTPNLDGFQENRHDQSVFSILVKKMGGAIVFGHEEVEVEGRFRDKGYRTYRKFKDNIFLALREKNGLVYSCSDRKTQKHHERIWDALNYIESTKKINYLLYTLFLKLPYLVLEKVDAHILRKYHQTIK